MYTVHSCLLGALVLLTAGCGGGRTPDDTSSLDTASSGPSGPVLSTTVVQGCTVTTLPHPGGALAQLLRDDVDGTIYRDAFDRGVRRWDDTLGWTDPGLPPGLDTALGLSVSGGRWVGYHVEHYYLFDSTGLVEEPQSNDLFVGRVAGVDGALMALGSGQEVEDGRSHPAGAISGSAGAPWQSIDLSDMPISIDTGFAADPDTLWLSGSWDGVNGVVRWEAPSTIVPISYDLPDPANDIHQGTDGMIWMTIDSTELAVTDHHIWRSDGQTLAPHPDLPPGTTTARRYTGGLLLLAVEQGAAFDLQLGPPGGPYDVLATDDVLRFSPLYDDDVMVLVGESRETLRVQCP